MASFDALSDSPLPLRSRMLTLIGMTRKAKIPLPLGQLRLQGAKSWFSGHGRDEVLVNATEDLRRLQGEPMGDVLIVAMQNCPYPDIDLEPPREHAPVREVGL